VRISRELNNEFEAGTLHVDVFGNAEFSVVIPAKASSSTEVWIPTFAGMTDLVASRGALLTDVSKMSAIDLASH
jgi:hypothetical protein